MSKKAGSLNPDAVRKTGDDDSKPRGFIAGLSQEQKAAALAYRGEEGFGEERFRLAVSESPGADRTLEDLLERVKGATGPDREIDADVHAAVTPGRITHAQLPAGYTITDIGNERSNRAVALAQFIHSGRGPAPSYTASLDAVVALCARLLPSWSFKLIVHPTECHCDLYQLGDIIEGVPLRREMLQHAEATQLPTPALALLAALLEALVKSRSPSLVG